VRKHLSIVIVLLLGLTAGLMAQEASENNSQAANVNGKWQMAWQGRNGQKQGTLQLQQDGSELSGTLQGERGSVPLKGTIEGNKISFSVEMQGRGSITVAYSGTVEGDKMNGTIQVQGGKGGGRSGRRGGGQQNHSWSASGL
jgi:hypothetical protein